MKSTGKIALAGMFGGLLSFGLMKTFENQPTQISSNHSDSTAETTSPVRFVSHPLVKPEAINDFTYAAEMSVNNVVHVTTEYHRQYSSDPFLDYFWGPGGSRGSRPEIATGSGVIISKDGYIVTNNHVINDADKIEITLNDDRTYEATLIGADPSTDLALVKIEETNLPFASFGNSDDVRVGEWVLAVGNPFSLTSTVTAGIVSAKARSINILKGNYQKEIFPLESFIQTDAAVNPGNSGGALVSATGELVGINTAIASRTGSYSGYSFAIPANIVKKVTEDLLEFGVVQRAFIGVSLQNITQKVADQHDLNNLDGVMVSGLAPDGAAQAAGIEINDVILKVGAVAVNDVPQIQEQIGRFRPGDEVALTVKRDGKEERISLVLRNKSGNTSVVKKNEDHKYSALGASFKRLSAQELKDLKIKNGVKVTSMSGGKLRTAGITEGFIITKLDQKLVNSPEEVVDFFNSKKGGVLVEGIYPNGMKGYFGFGL